MIWLNMDKVFSSATYRITKCRVTRFKGKMFGNVLVIEDIFDFAVKDKRKRHLCLCRCLSCGRKWIVAMEKLESCNCNNETGSNFVKRKNKALAILDREYNILKDEAVFKDEYKRLEGIATVREFVAETESEKKFIGGA